MTETAAKADVPRLALARGLVTAAEVEFCERIAREVAGRTGIAFPLGRIVLERLFAARPDLRRLLSSPGGARELLGADLDFEFQKFTPRTHQRFLERIEAEGRVTPADLEEALRIQGVLADLGVVQQVGEILVELGRTPPPGADELRDEPFRTERLPALSFERIAIYNGFLSEGEAAAARAKQQEIEKQTGLRVPIGRILYDTGHLRRVEVEAILEAQVKIGRLDPAKASLRIVKLSKPEEAAMLSRLMSGGGVDPRVLWLAQETSEKLKAFGLRMDTVEVLWLEGLVSEESLRDVLAHQTELLARLDPERPEVYLTLAPSADVLAQERPADLPEVDFLFGQAARIAGAITADELDRAIAILRRCRKDWGLGFTLGQILCSLHGRDPIRLARLQKTQIEIQELLDYAYEIHSLSLSPLEYEIVADRLTHAGPELDAELGSATGIVNALAEMGIEKDVTEILVQRGVIAHDVIHDLLEGRRERNLRLVGGWRSAGQGEAPGTVDSLLFERAFSSNRTTTGWGRGLLGALAVEEGLIDAPQIVKALYVQLRAREFGIPKPLGEVLVELGHLTQEQVDALLARQRSSVEAMPRPAPEDVEIPEDLIGEDRLLYFRLMTTGALDPDRLREVARLRTLLRSLGLAGSLREVLLKKGWLDQVVVDGLVQEVRRLEEERVRRQTEALARQAREAFPTADQIQQAYDRAVSRAETQTKTGRIRRIAVADRLLRSRRGSEGVRLAGQAALVAVVLAGSLGAGTVLFSVPTAEEAPHLVRMETIAAPEAASAPAFSPDAFAEAMKARGMVLVEGRWLPAGEAPPPDEATEGLVARRRRAFLDRPAAAAPEAESRPAAGPDATRRFRDDPPPFELAARTPERMRGLEAELVVDGDRTRIGIRLVHDLPAGSPVVVTVATRDDPVEPFHHARFLLDGPGRIQVEVAPYGRPLEPGHYVVAARHAPAFASRWRPGASLTEEEVRITARVGTEEAARARREASLRNVRAALETVAALAGLLDGPAEEVRLRSARAELAALERAHTIDPTDPCRRAREGLRHAARLTVEALDARLAGAGADASIRASIDLALESARATLEAAR